jgi:aromatic ring-opening dioxygenase catalytic subunit (LigB family)
MSDTRFVQGLWIEIGNIIREVRVDAIHVAVESHFEGASASKVCFGDNFGEVIEVQ